MLSWFHFLSSLWNNVEIDIEIFFYGALNIAMHLFFSVKHFNISNNSPNTDICDNYIVMISRLPRLSSNCLIIPFQENPPPTTQLLNRHNDDNNVFFSRDGKEVLLKYFTSHESRHSCSPTTARYIERARGHCRGQICSSSLKDVY